MANVGGKGLLHFVKGVKKLLFPVLHYLHLCIQLFVMMLLLIIWMFWRKNNHFCVQRIPYAYMHTCAYRRACLNACIVSQFVRM